MPDWKKEIKLSDLLSRNKAPKEQTPGPAVDPAAVEPKPAGEKSGLLKKEISFSLRRKPKVLDEDAGPKPPKLSRAEARAAKKEERAAAKAAKAAAGKQPRRSGRSARAAAPIPAVPLMRSFNLLPRDEVREGKDKRATPAQIGIAVAGLVAVAVLGAYFLMLNAKIADKQAQADSLRTAAAAHPQPGAQKPTPDEQADTALQAEQGARTAALAGALGKRIAWDRLLREFSLVVPEGVSLTKVTASGGGSMGATDPAAAPPPGTPAPESTFTIEGYTKSQESVAQLLSRLSVVPELATVDLESATRATLGAEEVVQFVIKTIVKPTSGATA